MLKIRIIPTLLFKNVGLVKGIRFNSWRRIGSSLPSVKVYNTRQVDELFFLDITASIENRTIDYEEVDSIADECFMPLTVGGGIRSINDIKNALRSGADKVSINSGALENPALITEGANSFGTQCIIVSIDVKKNTDGKYAVYSHAGTRNMNLDPVKWAKQAAQLGAGEILLTSIDNDGTMTGYDLEITRAVCEAVTIPVIASGGAGNFQHMADVLRECNASAVAAASIFHFTQQTPLEAKQFLAKEGFAVRL